jgi:hypothetical protein
MNNRLSRRDLFKGVGLGTIGFGLGASILDGIYKHAEALTEEEKHERGREARDAHEGHS